ncbi:flp pilus-assembly TadE/G-like family protein [Cutibacterium sp. WCA-380-WT-3A]|uniref:Flp pilus-assembly TadE/G-like family protein n=1 Tax=Cutibacterium porci TaxID=2605781 RepID=A0A7K0J4Q4_9ACTN|nr:Rv3654c family TadE-like protein [Cutibacterium porci]MSS44916.1 flp pilus-assembly TadE/G-like family protein [Cutibacterium porci]
MTKVTCLRVRPHGAKAARERGSGTLLLAAVGVGFVAAVWMSLLVTGWWSAAHRAEEIADIAALAAGGAQAVGEPGCPVAERAARANGAELASCVVDSGSGLSVTVEVEVQVHRGWELPGMPRTVVKSSRAGPVE